MDQRREVSFSSLTGSGTASLRAPTLPPAVHCGNSRLSSPGEQQGPRQSYYLPALVSLSVDFDPAVWGN